MVRTFTALPEGPSSDPASGSLQLPITLTPGDPLRAHRYMYEYTYRHIFKKRLGKLQKEEADAQVSPTLVDHSSGSEGSGGTVSLPWWRLSKVLREGLAA